MNFRIYIQKKIPFDIDSIKLYQEFKNMDISLSRVIIYYVYDIHNIKKELFLESLYKVFVDPVTDILHKKIHFHNPYFYMKNFTGKYNDRENAAIQCIKIINPKLLSNNISIKTSLLVELIGMNEKDNLNKIKKYYNGFFFYKKNRKKKYIKTINNFVNFSIEKINKIKKKWNLSIDKNDLLFIQKYFVKEKRNPTKEELHILDAYWSDHCRHRTFFTTLINISFHGLLKNTYEDIFNKYLKDRKYVNKSNLPINLMDISNLPSIIFYKKGKLKNYVLSNEHNASAIMIDVDIVGSNKKEKWYLLFKNETHNHPTEINPFSGAFTCIGGAIRDPLSGRAFVYQGLRLSGVSNPIINTKIFHEKLPQNQICYESASGYSSYGNKVGLATTHVNEIYHKGFRAKKMEVGMVVGAVPINFIKQKEPKKGDVILLIGGLTRREGIGDATNSSKVENFNLKNVKEGIKGDPITERKIQRFFRKKEVTYLIKKCNDLGAGGIAVAIGELSDSLVLYLDKIPTTKNSYLEAIEIALSESQERIAVVLNSKDVKKFIRLANEENIISTPIAKITDNKRIIFYYKKKEILNIKSSFMNTRGYNKNQSIIVNSPTSISPFKKSKKFLFSEKTFLKFLSKLNIASQKSLVEMFDSTVGATTVLMPFGGKYQMTPSEGSVQKIPILQQSSTTNTVSIVSWGYHPDVSTWSPFHGGAYAIVECISKIVSMGGNYRNTYFSFQEYYQKLGNDPENWGKPFSALLGAYHAQMSLELVSIGGKDSMSGTYKNIHVPPTLIAFGVCTGSCLNIISPEFKKIGNKIYLYNHRSLKNEMPDFDSIKKAYDKVYEGICSGKIVSVKTIKDGGISIAIAKMSFGNRLGAIINCKEHLLETSIGSLIIESSSTILDNNFILIGEIISSKNMIINGISININKSIKNWLKTLSPIFSYNEKNNEKNNEKKIDIKVKNRKKNNIIWKCKYKKKGIPRVFIPIFPGTNSEFESIRAFKKEEAIVNTFVFKTLSNKDIIKSIFHIKKHIESVQIFMLCGGFSAGDEPDGAGKLIVSILHNPYIKDAIQNFLDKDGLILGICNGFQGLIKSGLLPYGKICLRNDESPTLTYNKIKKHISQCVHIKVISDKSPWLNGMKNKIYTLPISHGEGRFYANEKIINVLFKKNQIATQYVDLQGNPSLDRLYNPNGSIGAVEGLLSEDGKIYGRMAHPERYDYQLLKNIPNLHKDPIFKNAVQYFS
ncbi:phosphoribosylformylglycinamidine synthase [Blattabacterium cuenoti]|uniref:phosphoribosylformylglycinamidine synthase n=1 Tax=Blattabacterium cuenoti TaxID=1653831 RepID=UPI00163BBA8C|nr:phosphoribosylformylglycinamidine synthase [Blattabacterium cuenoti]